MKRSFGWFATLAFVVALTACGEAMSGTGDAGGLVDAGSPPLADAGDDAGADGGGDAGIDAATPLSDGGSGGPVDAAVDFEDGGALGPDGGATTPDSGTGDGGPSVADDAGVIPMDAGPTDAGPMDAGPMDAGPMDAGMMVWTMHCGTEPFIAAIDPGAGGGAGVGTVAIMNPTGGDIAVDETTLYLYENPDGILLRDLEPGAIIPAKGFHRFPFPSIFSDGNASGEMVLFASSATLDGMEMLDFVCWGFGHTGSMFSSQPLAMDELLWSGGCGSGIAGPELRRIADTDGTTRDSYDPTGLTPLLTCP